MSSLDGQTPKAKTRRLIDLVPVKRARQQPNLSAVYVITVAVLAMIATLVWIAIMPSWYGR
jgi:hypothetical protein